MKKIPAYLLIVSLISTATLSACSKDTAKDTSNTNTNNTNTTNTTTAANITTDSNVSTAAPTTKATEAPTENAAAIEASGNVASSYTTVSTNGKAISVVNGLTYVDGILVANKSYQLPDSYSPGELNSEVLTAFNKMQAAAAKEGLNLYISSGFRSYSRQNTIYNNYVKADGQANADTYSARAGYSEHQTGLAFDLNTIDDSFAFTAEGKWVAVHAQEYGFIIRYPADKVDITGYQYEPWHLRYLGVDTATKVYNSGLCLEEYLGITSFYH